MHIPALPTLVAILHLSTGAQALYEDKKATQINFYTDNICTKYAGEFPFWQIYSGKHPQAGVTYSISDPDSSECYDFKQAAGTETLNLAGCWAGSSTPHPWCHCKLWDDWGCKGNVGRFGTGNSASGNCLTSRSSAGWQWKSIMCWVD
ncbi:hypothetical protein B0J13DRAFT_562657, partial [Dactylonectria estremocensis]